MERIIPATNILLAGTVMDIPFPVDVFDSNKVADHPNTILFDSGTLASIPLSEMTTLIPKTPVNVQVSDFLDSLLPPFLHLNSKITFKHDAQYHK